MRKTLAQPTNLDCFGNGDDLELQVRQVQQLAGKPRVRMTIYAWLSEKRKKENEDGKKFGWQYCPFEDDERFTLTFRGRVVKGKIISICRDFYDGDCLVLSVELDKRSSDSLTKANASRRQPMEKTSTEQLFSAAEVGKGATHHSGSDSYGFYISSVDPKTKTIGVYEPKHWFKHSWTDGHMEHEPFDPTHQPTVYLQAFRGSWYELDRVAGQRLRRFNLAIGHCSFYQDPSF